MKLSDRIIVALDFPSSELAWQTVEQLGDEIKFYKVGLQLLTSAGPDFVRKLVAANKQVFLDLKMLEIPQSVALATKAAGDLGVSMITVHASGGRKIMEAAVEAAQSFDNLEVLGLTVVTSLNDADLKETGVQSSCAEQALRLAKLAETSGCNGLIASPKELKILNQNISSRLRIVTPGITVSCSLSPDQTRSSSPAEAIRLGASQIIIGRAITGSSNPSAALKEIIASIRQ